MSTKDSILLSLSIIFMVLNFTIFRTNLSMIIIFALCNCLIAAHLVSKVKLKYIDSNN